MDEQKDIEQTSWVGRSVHTLSRGYADDAFKRIEPYGWDREDRTYYVLDDNRVYRLTEATPTQAQPKPKSKSMRSGRRSSKRQRSTPSKSDTPAFLPGQENGNEPTDDGLGGRSWECVAVTLQEVQELLISLGKTRDENEKTLRQQLETHLIPILEKQEESQKRKQLQKERELLNLAKMANAKRSSRIAGKVEKQKLEDMAKEEEEQLKAAEVSKRRVEQGRIRMEQDRDFRTFSRQRRLQEREARRLQHEEELAQLSEDSKAASITVGRMSERRRQAEIERNRQALEKLSQEGEEWVFDCVCGLFGQVDDGAHSVACEKCNVWQHSKCLGITEEEADRQDFHFVCQPCRRRNDAIIIPPKETTELELDSITCSAVGFLSIEHPEAGQSTTSVRTDDGLSKERNEETCPNRATSLSADTPLYSALERGQNARTPSIVTTHPITNKPESAPLSRQQNGDSIAVKTAEGVEEYDVSSTIVVQNDSAAVLGPAHDLGAAAAANRAGETRSGSTPSPLAPTATQIYLGEHSRESSAIAGVAPRQPHMPDATPHELLEC